MVFLPETVMNNSDGMVKLPLSVDNAEGILGFYFQIQYNPALFEFQSIEKGDLTGNWESPIVNNTNGTLKIAASGVQSINGKGTLTVLRLKNTPSLFQTQV